MCTHTPHTHPHTPLGAENLEVGSAGTQAGRENGGGREGGGAERMGAQRGRKAKRMRGQSANGSPGQLLPGKDKEAQGQAGPLSLLPESPPSTKGLEPRF